MMCVLACATRVEWSVERCDSTKQTTPTLFIVQKHFFKFFFEKKNLKKWKCVKKEESTRLGERFCPMTVARLWLVLTKIREQKVGTTDPFVTRLSHSGVPFPASTVRSESEISFPHVKFTLTDTLCWFCACIYNQYSNTIYFIHRFGVSSKRYVS